MCGNFGLLFVKNQASENVENDDAKSKSRFVTSDGFEKIESEENYVRNRTVSFSLPDGHADRTEHNEDAAFELPKQSSLRSPLMILEAQAANTEIRGGQAGGYSSLEYERVKNVAPVAMHPIGETVHSPFRSTHSVGSSTHSKIVANVMSNPRFRSRARTLSSGSKPPIADTHSPLHRTSDDKTEHTYQRNRTMTQTDSYTQFEAEYVVVPRSTRVRTVARKRYPLSTDLSNGFLKERKGETIQLDKTFTGTCFKKCFCCFSVLQKKMLSSTLLLLFTIKFTLLIVTLLRSDRAHSLRHILCQHCH